jgi:hypothetical protein
MPQEPGVLSGLASCSRGLKGDLYLRRKDFPVIDAVGNDSQGKSLDGSDSLFTRRAVRHDSRQIPDFGYPTAIRFPFNLYIEIHTNSISPL